MSQKYKVFIDGHPIFILSQEKLASSIGFEEIDANFTFLNLRDAVLNGDKSLAIVSQHPPEKMTVFSDCTFIRAAGGLVRCPEQKFLFIHRLGKWDLPKGKLENFEEVDACAIREVAEECSIKEPMIIQSLPPTYHTYPYKNGYALKRTDWYLMEAEECYPLTPQQEEDITDAKWFTRNEVEHICLPNTYPAIVDVWEAAKRGNLIL
jgi:ADP-ribose pyrophosphatase YjhB (NUDIX family)